jgi:membrane protein
VAATPSTGAAPVPANAERGGSSSLQPEAPSRFARARRTAGDFVRRVWKKAEQDQIFFMAGAIAFNVVVAVVPLILAVLGVAGLLLQSRYGAGAEETLVRYLFEALPPVSAEFTAQVRDYIRSLLDQSSGFLGVGTLIFAWFATRLVGTLRTALREVFDIQQDRGIIAGKFFDIGMVLVAGLLLTINVALTVLVEVLAEYGYAILGVGPDRVQTINQLYLRAGSLLTIWFMFLLVYRFLPYRRIQWRTATVAATFTAVFIELLKQAFTWYIANIASYRSAYANLANLFVIFLWIYYSAVLFILGGEVAQVWSLLRIRRQQKERLG